VLLNAERLDRINTLKDNIEQSITSMKTNYKFTSLPSIVLVIAVFAGIGTYLILSGHASTPYASVNADKGTLAGAATAEADSAAEDGNRVQFGSYPASTNPSGVAMPTSPPAGWGASTLAEDFSGASVNQSLWHLYDNQEVFGSSTSGSTHGNGPWWNASHSVVSGGMLALKIYQDTGEGQPSGTWESGGMGENTSYAQTYGKWEVRMKFPNGAGTGGVLLLWPQSQNWPSGGEIDFAETPGNDPRNIAYETNHWACPGTNNNCQNSLNSSVDWTQWHTWGVEWTPGKIVYTIDGQVVNTSTSYVPSDPMYLTMQDSETPPTACGNGGWYTCVNSSTPSEVDMDVDWAVAWQYP
jgi:beta-glucanase (GH16 family)